MRSLLWTFLAAAAVGLVGAQAAGPGIEITFPVACDRKTKSGDVLSVNYNGTFTNGELFDSSTYSLIPVLDVC
jgi:FK506-binding protein 2